MTPPPPKGTQKAGKRLWEAIVGQYELDEHEVALLTELVRSVDHLDQLAAIVEKDGLLLDSPSGPRVHPAAVESRQLRIAAARLAAALRLPSGLEDSRPQVRVGVRGVYKPRRVS